MCDAIRVYPIIKCEMCRRCGCPICPLQFLTDVNVIGRHTIALGKLRVGVRLADYAQRECARAGRGITVGTGSPININYSVVSIIS